MNFAGNPGSGVGDGGVVTHAAMDAARSGTNRRKGAAMEWIILEALVAVVLGAGILWWTMSPARKREREEERRCADTSAGGGERNEMDR
jgi:hypothetical protein